MSDEVRGWIDDLVKNNRVVLFMKGTPDFPQCGFSMKATNVVRALGLPFKSVNVLENWDIREGIKSYSDWPTIPQLYLDGQFIGGSDIMIQMFESGELQKLADTESDASA